MGFLNSLAGATQGNQDYQAWQQQQAAQKQSMQYQQMQMQAYAQQQQQAQQDRMNQGQMAQAQMIEIQSRQQRPPMPGQASQPQQPMQQPPMQYGQKPMGPQAAPPIPPYQSMQPKQPQQPMQQPQQQQPQDQGMIPAKPQKNEFEQLTDILAAKGITSPEAVLAAFQGRVSAQQAQALAQKAAEKEALAERTLAVKEKHEVASEKRMDFQNAQSVASSHRMEAMVAKMGRSGGGGGGGKAETPMGKLNDDLRNGRISQSDYDTERKIMLKDKSGQTVSDKMNPVMLATVRLDIGEGKRALKMIEDNSLKEGSVFFADHSGTGSVGRFMQKTFSPTDDQEFDVYANKLGQAIASAQSMGRGQISEAKINEATKSIPVRGDNARIRKAKMGELKNFFNIVEETLKSPISSRDAGADQQDVNDFSNLWK